MDSSNIQEKGKRERRGKEIFSNDVMMMIVITSLMIMIMIMFFQDDDGGELEEGEKVSFFSHPFFSSQSTTKSFHFTVW